MELRELIFGDSPHYRYLTEEQQIFANDSAVTFDSSEYEMTRDEAIKRNLHRTAAVKRIIKEKGLGDVNYTNYQIYGYPGNQQISTSIHHGMFEPMIRILGSDEQVKEYLDDILGYQILGCYAQTEMGHGSDVQRLETEAVFDEETDEFVVNSPTIKSAKFWPGEMGKMATHAVFHAKLIIKGETYGVNAFVARIRDAETHAPLKGLEIGDIGPKYGYHAKDNGYMIFTNFRIPRKALLSRYISCSKEGVLSINGDPKVAYSTMMLIRVMLLNLGWDLLLKCTLLVTRYLNFRTQFKSIPNSVSERKLIDYQATRIIVVPCVAFGYANLFAGKRLLKMLRSMEEEFKQEKFYTMKELHALLSSFKAYYMQETLDCFFTLREACGANGYSTLSNLPAVIELWSPNVTLEGDAMVMYQQTGKALFKVIKKARKGVKIFCTFAYLEKIDSFSEDRKIDDVYGIEYFTDVIKHSALFQISKTNELLDYDDGLEWNTKWNKKYQMEVVKAVKLHAIYTTAKMFQGELEAIKASAELKSKLKMLCEAYSCYNIIKYCDGAFLSGYVNKCGLLKIKDYYEGLVDNIIPILPDVLEPVSLCEDTLHSLVGKAAESGYEAFYSHAAKSRLNEKVKLSGVDDFMKPLAKKLKMAAKI